MPTLTRPKPKRQAPSVAVVYAWREYLRTTQGLDGRQYERVEPLAYARLEDALRRAA